MNAHTFEGNGRSIHELKLLFFQTLLDWANASGVFTSFLYIYLIFVFSLLLSFYFFVAS